MKRASAILLSGARPTERDEDDFFEKLRLPNGTFKTTGHGRLVGLDTWLTAQLTAPTLRVLDVAVSSGTTTVDLLNALTARGIAPAITACDLCINATVRGLLPGVEVLLDGHGKVLQLSTPLGIRGRPHSPKGSLVRTTLASVLTLVEGLCRLVPAVSPVQAVQLVSAGLRTRPEVEVVEHDLFHRNSSWGGRFDLVRAANILNEDYFDDRQLQQLIAILSTYLAENGKLLIARTDVHGVTVGSLFERTPSGTLRLLGRYGGGSSVEHLALTASPMDVVKAA